MRGRRVLITIVTLVAVALLILLGRRLIYPYPVGTKQPIPFSHRLHAGARQISCLFCHDGADRSRVAGTPEVSKCLLCHNVIIANFEPIRKLHGYYNRKEPIPWVRVNRLPDYVHFTHEMHLAAGIDCGHCHGNVKAMDRITPSLNLKMGFCVDCHKNLKATVDCYTCHY